MTFNNKNSFSVVFNENISKELDNFVNDLSFSFDSNVKVIINKSYFTDDEIIQSMITGYLEMASLNKEIVSEFNDCEDDAEIKLDKYRKNELN